MSKNSSYAGAELRKALMRRNWRKKETRYLEYLDRVNYLRKTESPLLSVIVISWRLHRDNLESFRILEKQRGMNIELIFVDNGAPEGEFRELEPYIDTYIRLNGNTGAYLARNLGAVFAEAPILLFLEDDGIPAENLLAAHLGLFKKYDLIACRGLYVPKTDNPLNQKQAHYYMGPNDYPTFAHVEGNTSYLAEAFFQVGGWDDEINFGGGGAELYLRLLEFDPDKRRQIYSPKPVIYHDYVKDEQHLQTKLERQRISHERLRKKYPQWDQVHAEARLHSDRDDLVKQRVERVLLVNHAIPPFENSGTPISTWNHARGLQKLGIETAVLVPSACEVRVGFKKENLNGITLYTVPRFDKHRAFLRQINRPALLLQLYSLERICKDFRPDIIQVNDYVYLPVEALALFHDLGVPVVRCVCNDEEICHQDYPVISEGLDGYLCSGPETAAKCAECFMARVRGLSRNNMPELELTRMEKLLADRAENTRRLYAEKIAGVIFTSPKFRDHFTSYVPISPDKTRIIPRGFEKPETAGLKKSGKNRSELRFAYFGTMLFSKGIDLILKAFAKTASSKGFRLDLYGIMVVPEFLNRINQLTAEFPGRIQYHGPYAPEDFPGLAAGSDLVIVPSYFDTYNRVLREALALGLPVIAADFFGSFIVQNEVNGLKFPVGDSEALTAAMNRLLTEPGLLKKIRAGAGKTLIPSLEDEIRAMVEFYRDILFERQVLKKDSIPPAAKKKKESMVEALADQPWTSEDGLYLRDIDRLLLSVIENSSRLPLNLEAGLFFDLGGGFSEQDKVNEQIAVRDDGSFSVCFSIPPRGTVRFWRFDPWEGYWGRVRIDGIKIKTRSGRFRELALNRLESNGVPQLDGFYLFRTADPIFLVRQKVRSCISFSIRGKLELQDARSMTLAWEQEISTCRNHLAEKEQRILEQESLLRHQEKQLEKAANSARQREEMLLHLAGFVQDLKEKFAGPDKKLVIFGTGAMSAWIMRMLGKEKNKINCFFDNRPRNREFLGLPVRKPRFMPGARVIIASMYSEQISRQLLELGYVENDLLSAISEDEEA